MQGTQPSSPSLHRSRPAFCAGIVVTILGLSVLILNLLVQGEQVSGDGIIKALVTLVYALDIALVLVLVLQAKLLSSRGAVAAGIITLLVIIASYTMSLLVVYGVIKEWDTILAIRKAALLSELPSVIMLGLTMILLAAGLGRLGRLARGKAFPALSMTSAVAALSVWAAGRGIAVYCVFQSPYKSIPSILTDLQVTFQFLGPFFVGLFFFAAAFFIARKGSASRSAKPAAFAGAVTTALYAACAVLMVLFVFVTSKGFANAAYGGIYTAGGLARIATILNGLGAVLLGVTVTLLASSFEGFRLVAEGAAQTPAESPAESPTEPLAPVAPVEYAPLSPAPIPPQSLAPDPPPVEDPPPAQDSPQSPPQVPPLVERYCSACGASHRPGARFCLGCGRKIGTKLS